MEINVQTDIAEALKKLTKLDARQMPFIVALAMNRTMKHAKEAEQVSVARVFDRPTPYTKNAFRTVAAKKDSLQASIALKDFGGKGIPAAKYLAPQVYGGDRNHKRAERALITARLMPENQYCVPAKDFPYLDQYGNIRGSYWVQVLSYLKAFSESGYTANRKAKSKPLQFFVISPITRTWPALAHLSHLPDGIYQRTSPREFTMRIAFVKRPKYTPRLPFFATAESATNTTFATELRRAAEYAISTSKSNITTDDIARAIGSLLGQE